jgi:hypothetical protein
MMAVTRNSLMQSSSKLLGSAELVKEDMLRASVSILPTLR